MCQEPRKIVVIGAGRVGTTYIYALLHTGLAGEIVLIDIDSKKVEGLSLVRISGAILRDEHSVLTVSSLLSGEYGIDDICLSVPCVVGSSGVERILAAVLETQEQFALEESAKTLRKVLKEIKL